MTLADSRRQGIGGTDIAKILGMSPWGNALSVYAEKVGLLPPEEEPDDDAKWFGRQVEPIVAELYQKKHPDERVVAELSDDCPSFVHRQHEWWIGRPDRVVYPPSGKLFPLEIKVVGRHRAGEFGLEADSVPAEYALQVRWYIGLLDAPFGRLAASIGGTTYREYHLERDLAIEEHMREVAERFWKENILKRHPPAPDASEKSREVLLKMFPANTSGTIVPADGEADRWAMVLRRAQEVIAKAEIEEREAKHHLMKAIGDNDGIAGTWGKITWKRAKDTVTVDWETAFATLREAIASDPVASKSPILKTIPEIIKTCSSVRPGTRVFRAYFSEEEK